MTQATLPLIDIDALVRDDEVHRDCYVSNEVFDLEMERIFGQAWVYVCLLYTSEPTRRS